MARKAGILRNLADRKPQTKPIRWFPHTTPSLRICIMQPRPCGPAGVR